VNFGISKHESYTDIKVLNDKLDALIAPDLKAELVVIVKNGEKNITIDLSICQHCDSSGLSSLLLGNRLCNELHGGFVLYGIAPEIRSIIELLGFDSQLKISDSREAALRWLT
jgi:anti-sigma B factor antagonist